MASSKKLNRPTQVVIALLFFVLVGFGRSLGSRFGLTFAGLLVLLVFNAVLIHWSGFYNEFELIPITLILSLAAESHLHMTEFLQGLAKKYLINL